MRIRITMPCEDRRQRKEYIGEYCGHGQTKTAFILEGTPSDPYNGKILKVAANYDHEPYVFTEMTVQSPGTAPWLADGTGERVSCPSRLILA